MASFQDLFKEPEERHWKVEFLDPKGAAQSFTVMARTENRAVEIAYEDLAAVYGDEAADNIAVEAYPSN